MVEKSEIFQSIKRYKYTQQIVDYVVNNNGCSLYDIKENITKDDLSLSTICRVLKENDISRKKIYTKVVCKDIPKINIDKQNFKLITDNTFYDYISIDESIK